MRYDTKPSVVPTPEQIAIACDWVKDKGLDFSTSQKAYLFPKKGGRKAWNKTLFDNFPCFQLMNGKRNDLISAHPYIPKEAAERMCEFLGLDVSEFFCTTGADDTDFVPMTEWSTSTIDMAG